MKREHSPFMAHVAEDNSWMIARYDWARVVMSGIWYAFYEDLLQ